MKKIIFGIFLFCILGITNTYAFPYNFTYNGDNYTIEKWPNGRGFYEFKNGTEINSYGNGSASDNSLKDRIIAIPRSNNTITYLYKIGGQGYRNDLYASVQPNKFIEYNGKYHFVDHWYFSNFDIWKMNLSHVYDMQNDTLEYRNNYNDECDNFGCGGSGPDTPGYIDIPNDFVYFPDLLNSNLTCETTLKSSWDYNSYSYDPSFSGTQNIITEDNSEGILNYTKDILNDGTDYDFTLSIENFGGDIAVLGGDGTLTNSDEIYFGNKLFPLDSQAFIKLQSGYPRAAFDYFQVNGTGALFTAGDCDTGELYFGGKNLEYGETYKLDQGGGVYNLCLFFERASFNPNIINSIDFGDREEVYIESEYCYNEDNGQWSIDGEEVGTEAPDPESPTPPDDTITETNFIVNQFEGFSSGTLDIQTGYINSPTGEIGNSCDMFNDSGDFIYSTNGEFIVNLSLSNMGLPNGVASVADFLLKPVNSLFNSVLTAGSIFTPITQNTEGKKYCLLGIIVEYKARPFLEGNEYQYKLFMLDYFFLLIYYVFLFRMYYYVRHNTLILMDK